MNYLTYGNKQDKAMVFIHGMASTALLCYESILKYFENYYVVLVEVDGHSKSIKGDLLSLEDCCDDIEKYIPQFLMDSVMGKGNNSVIEMLYQDVTSETIINACEFVYKYNIPVGLRNYKNPVLFLRGERETYPKKSAAILKNYLPQTEEKVLEGMGHGQYLHEHPSEYANALLRFFSEGM